MPFYYLRIADQPVHYTSEPKRYNNLVISNVYDSPELLAAAIERLGSAKAPYGTNVLRTSACIVVSQKLVVEFAEEPTLKQLERLNAKADKALFDAKMAAKTLFDRHGNQI